jgi:hypothetical protein
MTGKYANQLIGKNPYVLICNVVKDHFSRAKFIPYPLTSAAFAGD